MPRYDYQCKSCECVFERTLKISENELPMSEPCPNCNECGHIVRYFGTDSIPLVADPYNVMGLKRMPTDFQNKLTNIKRFYKQDHINDGGTIT